MIIDLPLFIDLPRKTKKDTRVYINLNIYRNLHYQLNNQVKRAFKEMVAKQLRDIPVLDKIHIHYTLYPRTKQLCDTSNICCIADKFFSDALVELGIIPDDNYQHITGTSNAFGAIDKLNPRVEALVSVV